MAPLRERGNLFRGTFRIAPPPLIPNHWHVPREHPSARYLWVNDDTGKASRQPLGFGREYKEILKLWHTRQAMRVWVCRRLIHKLGLEGARQRIRSLEQRLSDEVSSPNSYLDLLLAITFEAYYLGRQLKLRNEVRRGVRQRARKDASWWNTWAPRVERWSPASGEAARTVVAALEAIASDPLLVKISPPRIDNRFPDEVSKLPRDPRRAVWRWVDYQMRSSRFRNAGLNWLLARAILRHKESTERRQGSGYQALVENSRQRVLRYLELLDAFPAGPSAGVPPRTRTEATQVPGPTPSPGFAPVSPPASSGAHV